MSTQDKNTTHKPDFVAYNVRESRDGKGHWHKIGAAWQHRDGQGYDIALDSLPVDGRVTLREMREARTQESRTVSQPTHASEHAPTRGRDHGRNR